MAGCSFRQGSTAARHPAWAESGRLTKKPTRRWAGVAHYFFFLGFFFSFFIDVPLDIIALP